MDLKTSLNLLRGFLSPIDKSKLEIGNINVYLK